MGSSTLLQGLRSLIFPTACLGCGAPSGDEVPLCTGCLAHLPHNTKTLKRNWPSIDQVVAPLLYEGLAKDLIGQLKYRSQTSVAPFLSKLLSFEIRSRLGENSADLVVPVPLHATRRRERSFNQAQLLAVHLGKSLSLPSKELLLRQAPTFSQTQLPRNRRLKNVAGAFALRPERQSMEGLRILLVDDVFTTGATAESCAALLKEAGARRVIAATVCAAVE